MCLCIWFISPRIMSLWFVHYKFRVLVSIFLSHLMPIYQEILWDLSSKCILSLNSSQFLHCFCFVWGIHFVAITWYPCPWLSITCVCMLPNISAWCVSNMKQIVTPLLKTLRWLALPLKVKTKVCSMPHRALGILTTFQSWCGTIPI